MSPELLKRFTQIQDSIWELPKAYRKAMKVPVRIIATRKLLEDLDDGAVDQAVNVASLPGIVGYSWMMPDAHFGYGFPIGGVAAFDAERGIISPGGVGFDINCGMRLMTTGLYIDEVRPRIKELVDELFKQIPAGVGVRGFVRISPSEFREMMVRGAGWVVERGMGFKEDLTFTEENGGVEGVDPESVSERAIQRGLEQLGTLGSGNHYLEVQKVDKIFNPQVASVFGIERENQIIVMFHCGSRGFGHQVGTDYLRIFEKAMNKHGIKIPDIQLACAPFTSPEGKRYFSAMKAGVNTAFANRQVIAHRVREGFNKVLGTKPEALRTVYDVSHNTAKLEAFDGRQLVVHRKGATRAFGAHTELPKPYQDVGQPVIIGGSMETGSYLLVGTQKAMQTTFGSTCHGSGRTMSRVKAKGMVRGETLQKEMQNRGIYVRSASWAGLAEEAGFAYKDIHEVIRSVELAGISKPVASFVPLGNVKG